MTKKATTQIPVMVTTKHRGVFIGLADPSIKSTDERVRLTQAVMAIRWGTTKGLLQLADTGPTGSTSISAPADCDVCDLTGVFLVTETAWGKWQEATCT